MKEFLLFTDGSVNTQTKVGYGAYLFLPTPLPDIELIKPLVQIVRFEQTSSSKLELQTLLHALHKIEEIDAKITVYTDSQNIVGLLERRQNLEQNNYMTSKNKQHNNYLLYQTFFNTIDKFNYQILKIKGHKTSKLKDNLEKIFTLVDRASRNAVRSESMQKD